MASAPLPSTWQSKGAALFSIPLLVRPQPKPNEHYLGYWLRTVDENGLTIPSWLTLPKADPSLPKGVGRARWCSCCLAKHDAYWQTDWDTGWAMCLEHQCWLEDTCPACKKVTRWRSIRYAACKCEFALADAALARLPPALNQLLVPRSGTMSMTDRWMTLEVTARLRLAEFIGSLQLYGLYGKPLKKVSGTAVATQRKALTVGSAILVDEDGAIHGLLKQLRRPPTHPSVPQLINEAFPGLLNRMRKCLPPQEQAYLWREIQDYLANTLDTGQPVLWNRKQTKSSLSARDCAARLRIRPDRVKDLLLECGVPTAIRKSSTGRTMLAVSPDQLGNIESHLQAWMPYRQVARMYGFSPARQKELVRAGWLQGRDSKVQEASIHRIFDKLNAASLDIQKALVGQVVTLHDALQRYIPIPLTDTFMKALIGGEIGLYVNRDAIHHCDHMLVAMDDLLAFPKKEKRDTDTCLSLPDAALQLGMKQEVLYHLVNQRHIAAVTRRIGRRPARFISMEEVSRFTQENESLAAAALRSGIGARAAVRWAKENDLEVFSGPGIDGGRQYFVRRTNSQR